MDLVGAREQVRKDLKDALTAVLGSIARVDWTAFNAEGFEPGDPDASVIVSEQAWWRPYLAAVSGSSRPFALGVNGPTYRELQLLLNCYVPLAKGDAIACELLASVAAYFRYPAHREVRTASGVLVRYREPDDVVPLPPLGRWAQFQVEWRVQVEDYS